MVSLSPNEDPSALIDYSLQTTSNGTNSSLLVQVSIDRAVSWSANVSTSKGTHNLTWTQSITYENYQNYTATGSNETLWQSTTGTALSQVDGTTAAELQFHYPISFFQAYVIPTDATAANSTLYAVLDRSKHETGRTTLTHLVYPGTTSTNALLLSTRQNGSCFYLWNNTYYEDAGAIDPAEGTIGATSQWFTWEGDVDGGQGRVAQNYSRFASAIDGYEPVLTVGEVSEDLISVPATEIVTGPGINVLPEPSETNSDLD